MKSRLRLLWLALVLVSLPTRAIEEGEMASAPFGIGSDSEPVSPASLRGKVVVALYWASWCGYCRKAMPDFLQFQQVAGEHGLQVVFINTKEDREVFRNAKRWAADSTAVMAHDRKGTAMESYGGESFPYIVLLDRAGVVRKIGSGYGAKSKAYYANTLSELLQEVTPPQAATSPTTGDLSSADIASSSSGGTMTERPQPDVDTADAGP